MDALSVPDWDDLVAQLRLLADYGRGKEIFETEYRNAYVTKDYERRIRKAQITDDDDSENELPNLFRFSWLLEETELSFCELSAVDSKDKLLTDVHDLLVELCHGWGGGTGLLPSEQERYQESFAPIIRDAGEAAERLDRLAALAGGMKARSRREWQARTHQSDRISNTTPSERQVEMVRDVLQELGKTNPTRETVKQKLKDKFGRGMRTSTLGLILNLLRESDEYTG